MSKNILSKRLPIFNLVCTSAIVLVGLANLFGTTSHSQQVPAPTTLSSDVSTLGDVKYSVLDPDHFRQLNGKGWVLMEGQDISESGLFKLIGMQKVPDARGVFIRGMNLGRDAAHGDPGGNRDLGTPQADDYLKHNHEIAYYSDPRHDGWRYYLSAAGYDNHQQAHDASPFATLPTKDSGGEETRPRNIVLYTYIKIGD